MPEERFDFERVPTGIPGLDELIEGGFVKGSTVLVSGATGTGKTIFCVQFLMEGLKRGEKCMFITLEQKTEDIVNDVKRFGWDLKKYIDEKKLFLEYYDPFQVVDITSPLIDKIKENGIQRVAVDSTTLLGLYYEKSFELRKQLFKLLSGLKESGATSVITSELPEKYETLAKFGVEEFVVDGVILLRYDYLSPNPLTLVVRKMRRTEHFRRSVVLEITENGISLKSPKK